MLSAIELPQGWYQLKISKQCLFNKRLDSNQSLYLSPGDNLCSLSPVFNIKDINKIVCGILGWNLDTKKIDAELEKVRKTLNIQGMMNNVLFDPESSTEEQRR